MTSHDEQLRVAKPLQTQHATLPPDDATSSATPNATGSLKALASAALQRLEAQPTSQQGRNSAQKQTQLDAQPEAELRVASPIATQPATAALTSDERARIKAWLDLIGETDQPTIDEVLERCASNPDCRAYYLRRSAEATPEPEAPQHWGELRPCAWCTELMQSGQCTAAQRGELATRNYTPVVWIPRRCPSYKPRLRIVGGEQ